MPSKLRALKQSAMESAKFRKHRMSKFVSSPGTRKESATSMCLDCTASVTVQTKPAPNSIDIGGAAVAVNCENHAAKQPHGTFIIEDWAGNTLFNGKEFDSFESGWEYIHGKFPKATDEELGEYFVMEKGAT